MINVIIEHKSGEKKWVTNAENMKDLLDNVLPREVPLLKNDLPLFLQTKRFKRDPEGEELKERESGWYYDC